MSRFFNTAKEREAYHAEMRDVNWRHKVHEIKASRTRMKRVLESQREQERINRALDASPVIEPLEYRRGEKPDEPLGYAKPDSRRSYHESGSARTLSR